MQVAMDYERRFGGVARLYGHEGAEAIAKAKENLAKGDLIPTNENYHGAVRLREKTPEEVAAERAARKITA